MDKVTIHTGYVNNDLCDGVGATSLKYYTDDSELVLGVKTENGFMAVIIEGLTSVLDYSEIRPEHLERLQDSIADMAFVAVNEQGIEEVLEIDVDGTMYGDTEYFISNIWEVTEDDYEEFLESLNGELFSEFNMYNIRKR